MDVEFGERVMRVGGRIGYAPTHRLSSGSIGTASPKVFSPAPRMQGRRPAYLQAMQRVDHRRHLLRSLLESASLVAYNERRKFVLKAASITIAPWPMTKSAVDLTFNFRFNRIAMKPCRALRAKKFRRRCRRLTSRPRSSGAGPAMSGLSRPGGEFAGKKSCTLQQLTDLAAIREVS